MGRDLKINIGNMVGGRISLPASKSISNRALVINALAGGTGKLENLAECDDTAAMVAALKKFREAAPGEPLAINIGAAGTAMRFLTAYFAMQEGHEVVLDGSERMRQRPIATLVDALRDCGADISYGMEEGFPPLVIKGKKLSANGGITIDGGISSQYISAMMMIAPYMDGGLDLRIAGKLTSRPYVEMTAGIMRFFGADVEVGDNQIRIAGRHYDGSRNFSVESDWSAASYWYEIKSLFPLMPVTLTGFALTSWQGDSRVREIFKEFGILTIYNGRDIELAYYPSLKSESLDLDMSGQPALAQTVVVAACLHDMPFVVRGLKTLKIKETDRIAALISQLAKLGYAVEEGEDCSLVWDGSKSEAEGTVEIATFDDHRMAMAFAPAAAKFNDLVVLDSGVVSKSYPEYWKHLEEVGFKLEEWKGR